MHQLRSKRHPEYSRSSPASDVPETALLSEATLAEDWNRPEEDEAWSHLLPTMSQAGPPSVDPPPGFRRNDVLECENR